jgi:hypothetical protein
MKEKRDAYLAMANSLVNLGRLLSVSMELSMASGIVDANAY